MASKKPGPYAPLSAHYADDEKIMEAGEDAELMYLRMLAYAARVPRAEGWISDAVVLSRLGILPRYETGSGSGIVPGTDPGSRAERLAEVGLIERDGGGYRIASWLRWNESAEQMDRRRAQDKYRKSSATSTDTGKGTGSGAGSRAGKREAPSPDSADQKQNQNQKQNLSPTERGARTRAHALPDDWTPTEEHRALAAERGVDCDFEAMQMRDWAAGKGETGKDWDARFRNWLRKARPEQSRQQRPNRDAASAEALVQAHFDMQTMGGPQ